MRKGKDTCPTPRARSSDLGITREGLRLSTTRSHLRMVAHGKPPGYVRWDGVGYTRGAGKEDPFAAERDVTSRPGIGGDETFGKGGGGEVGK